MNKEKNLCSRRPELLYGLPDWTFWDRTINDSANDFFAAHLVWPDRLIANTRTLEKIDRAAEEKEARGVKVLGLTGCPEDADSGEEGLPVRIIRFVGRNYFLDLYVNENVPDDAFLLVRETRGEAPGIGWN